MAAAGVGARLVYLLPPSREELERRIRGRATDTDEAIARRLDVARAELAEVGRYEYAVVNDSLDDAVAAIASILRSWRFEREAATDRIGTILESFGLPTELARTPRDAS